MAVVRRRHQATDSRRATPPYASHRLTWQPLPSWCIVCIVVDGSQPAADSASAISRRPALEGCALGLIASNRHSWMHRRPCSRIPFPDPHLGTWLCLRFPWTWVLSDMGDGHVLFHNSQEHRHPTYPSARTRAWVPSCTPHSTYHLLLQRHLFSNPGPDVGARTTTGGHSRMPL